MYIGSTEGIFKARYYNHKSTFNVAKYKNRTTLANYIWKMKEKIIKIPIGKCDVRRRPVHISGMFMHICMSLGRTFNLLLDGSKLVESAVAGSWFIKFSSHKLIEIFKFFNCIRRFFTNLTVF